MNEYEKEANILKGQDMAEKQAIKEKLGVDWKDGQEVKLYQKEKHSEERKRELDRVVPSRVCPCCKRRIWLDKLWVITRGGQAYCRSCYYCKVNPNTEKIVGSFITETSVRFNIDSWKLKSLRVKSGIGFKAFADLMGWTDAYQYRIENGQIKSLRAEVVDKMLDVFDDVGVVMANNDYL